MTLTDITCIVGAIAYFCITEKVYAHMTKTVTPQKLGDTIAASILSLCWPVLGAIAFLFYSQAFFAQLAQRFRGR